MRRRLLVVADKPDGDGRDRDLVALLAWLDGQGWPSRLLVWDRADLGPRLARRPVVEVEAINRWRLPQRLEQGGRHGAMRRLRNLRVRWWWLRMRRCRVVLLWGAVRPEVQHYLPPGLPVVAELTTTASQVAGGPSEEVAAELADLVVTTGRSGSPSATDDSTVVVVAPRSGPATAAAGRHLVVGSWGPSAEEPLAGAEVFLRVVWTLHQERPDLDVHGVWVGGDERSRSWFPTIWERTNLGLDGVVDLLPERCTSPGLAEQVHVLVLTSPRPTRRWPTERLVQAGVPVAGFRSAAADADHSVRDARTVAWPDVRALADEVAGVLDQVRAGRDDLTTLVDVLERA